MAKEIDLTGITDLQFFGKISASISHEIKNVLAIINENAGLLEDLTMMADRGTPLDPARLKTMAETVQQQIRRADGIVKNMNRFAHSVDQTITTVDLAQTIELLIAITARFAAMKGVQVDLHLPETPVSIQTDPFHLMNLLWLCLDFSMSVSGDDKRLELVANETEDGACILFGKLDGLTESLPDSFPSDRVKTLLETLEADMKTDLEHGKIKIRIGRQLE